MLNGAQQESSNFAPNHNQKHSPQKAPLDFTMHQQQQVPFHAYNPNYPSNYPVQNHPDNMRAHAEAHQAKLASYYHYIKNAHNSSVQEQPEAKHPASAFQLVSQQQLQHPPPSPQNDPDFENWTMSQIASHFNVYISKAIVEDAEALLVSRKRSSKNLAKLLLRRIIGDDVIVTQNASGGRVYKAADKNILSAVEAIVNSRFPARHDKIDIYNTFQRLSDYMREKRRNAIRKQQKPGVPSATVAMKAIKRNIDGMKSSKDAPAPAAPFAPSAFPQVPPQAWYPPPQGEYLPYQPPSHYGQQVPTKRPFLGPQIADMQQMPPTHFPAAPPAPRFYGPGHQYKFYSSPAANATVWPNQQVFWNQYSVNPSAPAPHIPLSPEATSIESSNYSPAKVESPDSVQLDICDSEDVVAAENGGASQGPSSQPFSQEYWEFQSQREQFYDS